MEKNSEHPSDRVVLLADDALIDFANIDNVTAAAWGAAQADRYVSFLSATMQALAAQPELGRVIDGRAPYHSYLAKYRKSRWANGHRIVYQEIANGIEVIRILHSKMNLPDHTGDDK